MRGSPLAALFSLTCVLGISIPTDGAEAPTADEGVRHHDLERRPLQTFTNADLADYLPLKAAASPELSPAERLGFFAEKSIGQPFRPNAVRFDLGEADCVALCERLVAMSLSRDWQGYHILCDRLRHAGGVVSYRNRNFRTMQDWVPEGALWCWRDITGDLGPPGTAKPFTVVTRPKVFIESPAAPGSKFTRTVFKGSDYDSKDTQERSDSFIPRDRVAEILPSLRTGDIVLVIIRAKNNGEIGCDHMGVVKIDSRWRDPRGDYYMIHACPPKVRRENINRFLFRFQDVEGLKFLRLREDVKERAEAEVSRLSAVLSIPSAAAEDLKVEKLRTKRLLNAKQGEQ